MLYEVITADVRIEGTYGAQVQCHTCLESHGSVAHWIADDELVVYCSTQAVSGTRGLVVPVLRDADQLSLADLEKKIGDFAQAREHASPLASRQPAAHAIALAELAVAEGRHADVV